MLKTSYLKRTFLFLHYSTSMLVACEIIDDSTSGKQNVGAWRAMPIRDTSAKLGNS
jgi:hypothetical protein